MKLPVSMINNMAVTDINLEKQIRLQIKNIGHSYIIIIVCIHTTYIYY